MRQIQIPKYGNPDVLTIIERDIGPPLDDQVQIKVEAAGVNFADILARKGLYPDAPKAPVVVGYEVSGVISHVGKNVSGFSPGQAVIALTRFGGYSDVVNVPALQAFHKPEKLSFAEAAAIPVNYLTAYQLIVVMGGLAADETVLVHNAGGGVGLAALDIARHIGAKVIGTASPGKHDFLLERGFDHLVDYRRKDWPDKVMELTNGRGVELILDPLGGPSWKINLRLLRSSGRLGLFGVSSVTHSRLLGTAKFLGLLLRMPILTPLPLLDRNIGVFGVNLAHMWQEADKIQTWAKELLSGVEQGWIRPTVAKSFSFEEAAAAHRYIEERQNIGKVVLVP